ncbi:MAG: hypothetical protein LC808_05630 [Actinobacteria bacterium]|nr:hypothetical protein [Actinomycetota bacterium]
MPNTARRFAMSPRLDGQEDPSWGEETLARCQRPIRRPDLRTRRSDRDRELAITTAAGDLNGPHDGAPGRVGAGHASLCAPTGSLHST